MDYFVNTGGTAYADAGLMDLMLRARIIPVPGWSIDADGHYFATAADYTSPIDDAKTTDVGYEFDLTVSTTKIEGLGILAGASIFSAKDAFAGVEDPDPGFWSFIQATVDF
jgi:hypothetical protein